MSNPIRSIRIEVSGWPDDEQFDPRRPLYQWDLYVDGEEFGGGTGPGGAISNAYYAIESLMNAQFDPDGYFPWDKQVHEPDEAEGTK